MARDMDFVDECYADKDLSLLKKLTLVIPTYNRNYYLSRCLWYHAHFPFGQIIVADSSPEEKKVVNRETVAKIREMFGADILYLEYEPETDKYGGDIYQKWGDAVLHVETEYSQILTDKAFRIPTLFVNAIAFLSENMDYVASKPGTEHNISNKSPYPLMSQTSTQPDHVREPLDIFLNSICNIGWTSSIIFAVFRTETLKEIYRPIVEQRINDIRYGELHIGYSGYLRGRIHNENNNPFIIRDVSRVLSDKPNSESSNTRYHPIYSYRYLLFPRGRRMYYNYRSELSKLISSHIIKINHYESKKMVDDEIRPKIFIKCFNFPNNKLLYLILIYFPILSLSYPLVKKILDFLRENLFSGDTTRQEDITITNINEIVTEETKIISQIVTKTAPYHSDDKPVLDIKF